MKKQYKIIDPIGLHARPAANLVKIAEKSNSEITIEFEKRQANLKSILGTMSLGVGSNDIIIIEAIGKDSNEILNLLTNEIEKNGLGKEL